MPLFLSNKVIIRLLQKKPPNLVPIFLIITETRAPVVSSMAKEPILRTTGHEIPFIAKLIGRVPFGETQIRHQCSDVWGDPRLPLRSRNVGIGQCSAHPTNSG